MSAKVLEASEGLTARQILGFTSRNDATPLKEEEAEEQIKSYYEPKQGKFLQYQWGVTVTVTALARVRLQSLIDLTYKDFVYADTDSVKIENGEKYLPLI